MPTHNWASALKSTYVPPQENSLLAQTGDMATFMDWYYKQQGISKITPKDLEGPVFEIVKVFHHDVIHLQFQMEECHKLLTDQVDDATSGYKSQATSTGRLADQCVVNSKMKGGILSCSVGLENCGFKDNDSTLTGNSHLKEGPLRTGNKDSLAYLKCRPYRKSPEGSHLGTIPNTLGFRGVGSLRYDAVQKEYVRIKGNSAAGMELSTGIINTTRNRVSYICCQNKGLIADIEDTVSMEYPSEVKFMSVIYESTHNEDGNPSRATSIQALGRSTPHDLEDQAKIEVEGHAFQWSQFTPNASTLSCHVKSSWTTECLQHSLSQNFEKNEEVQSLRAMTEGRRELECYSSNYLDTMSMDDICKKLKVYEPEVKGMSSSSSSTQNMAFVSSSNNNNSSTNGAVNTAQAVNIANGVSTANTHVNASNIYNLSDPVICAFLASQPNNPQLAHEDLQQIYPYDLE
ncbi:hypothetical protein Tco_0317376 [Tanacetum coccineum]